MAMKISELDGRKWGDNTNGGSVERRFRITGLDIGFDTAFSYQGLPEVGDKHPNLTEYSVVERSFEEGRGSEKQTVVVTVKYQKETEEKSGEGEGQQTFQVDDWGWDSGTEERELVDSVDGDPVLNSAGDVFDRVPTVTVAAPTFTKVVRFTSRQSGAMGYSCKVNGSAVTIGGQSYPEASLLCSVSERRIFGDPKWKYRYSISLKFRSNPVKLEKAETVTDVGWDVAITDAGMRELDKDGNLRLIKAVDTETGKKCTVNSPELLDGQGAAVDRSSSSNPTPYNMRFKAYERASFPNWFYSEPS